MKKLGYILGVVGSFLGLNLSQSLANRAIDDLVTAETVRTRIATRGLDHLPNTYDIFTKLNRINAQGPVATLAEQKVIIRSVMINALFVDYFQTLMAQYLAESHNPATLPTRMAYLAISAVTEYFSEHSVQVDKQKGIRDIALKYGYCNSQSNKHLQESFGNNQDLFTKQLTAFYNLTVELWKQCPSWAKSGEIRPQSEWGTYPGFYQDILNKIENSPRKQANHAMFMQYLDNNNTAAPPPIVRANVNIQHPSTCIEGNAIDVIEWLEETICDIHNCKNLTQRQQALRFAKTQSPRLMETIAAHGLSIADVDTLIQMFSLQDDYIIDSWAWVKKQAVDVEPTIAVRPQSGIQPGSTPASMMKEQPREDPHLCQWTETFETRGGRIEHTPTTITIFDKRGMKRDYQEFAAYAV